jgi:hypothetical protein
MPTLEPMLRERLQQAGSAGSPLGRQRGQGHSAQWHEEKAKTDALDPSDPDDRRLWHVRSPTGHRIERPRRNGEAKAEQTTCIDASDQGTDDYHGDYRADASGTYDEAISDERIMFMRSCRKDGCNAIEA